MHHISLRHGLRQFFYQPAHWLAEFHAELRDTMVSTHDPRWARVGKNRVAKLMRDARPRGVSNRRSYVVTTERNKRERPAPDLVNRKFVATAPNQLWVANSGLTLSPAQIADERGELAVATAVSIGFDLGK